MGGVCQELAERVLPFRRATRNFLAHRAERGLVPAEAADKHDEASHKILGRFRPIRIFRPWAYLHQRFREAGGVIDKNIGSRIELKHRIKANAGNLHTARWKYIERIEGNHLSALSDSVRRGYGGQFTFHIHDEQDRPVS